MAVCFAPLVAAIGVLFQSLSIEHLPNKWPYDQASKQAFITVALVVVIVFTPMFMLLVKADRQDAENWQTYIRDHKCVAVDMRTRTEYHFNPATKMNQPETFTEYLWRCEGGYEHWRR